MNTTATQAIKPRKKTRAEIQAHIDDLRMKGEIDRDQWSVLFDDLSNTGKYNADGLIEQPK